MKTTRVLATYRGFYRHRKPLKDETGPRVENRRVLHSIAAFPRQYQGLRSLVFVRTFLWLPGPSWYIPFLVISPEHSSDVRRSLDSTYLLDDPLLGLHEIRD